MHPGQLLRLATGNTRSGRCPVAAVAGILLRSNNRGGISKYDSRTRCDYHAKGNLLHSNRLVVLAGSVTPTGNNFMINRSAGS